MVKMLIGYPHCGTSSIRAKYQDKVPYMHNEHIVLTCEWEKVPLAVDEVIISYRHPVDVYTTSVLYNRSHGLNRLPAIYDYVADTTMLKAIFKERFTPILFERWTEKAFKHNPTYCFRSVLLRRLTDKLFHLLTGVDSTYLQQSYQNKPRLNPFHFLYAANESDRPDMDEEARAEIYSRLGMTVKYISTQLNKLGVPACWT